MFLRSATKLPILTVFTKHHISEAFRIDLLINRRFYGQQQNHQFLVLEGGLTKQHFFMRGVIVPPSKLIVTNIGPL